MGRKASGKERVDITEKPQANGSVYVYRRVSAYNSEKGYYTAKEQKLIGKKMPGSDEIIPTRPKAPKGTRKTSSHDVTTSSTGVSASRVRMGAAAIVDFIGRESGIDADVYTSCDEATAKKIISLARYYLQSDGEATSHIEKWQLTHQMFPYGYPISEDCAHDLFMKVGADEAILQSVFFNRAKHLDGEEVLAYDASTVSTYGHGHVRARYGYNKDADGLETDKLFTFYSEDNLSLMFQASYNFITRAQYDLKWIRPEIDKALKRIEDTGNMCPDEAGTYGVTVCLTHEFEKIRKYGSRKKGLNAGDTGVVS